MKKIIFISGIMLTLISCSSEDNAKKQITSESLTKDRLVGSIPSNHIIYQGLMAEYDLNRLDKLYREEFNHPDSLKLDYNISVKTVAFYLLMQKGLVEKGTLEQKKYYLDQQLKLEGNIPDTERFYLLLSSCKELDKRQVIKIEEQYYLNSKSKFKEAFEDKKELEKRLKILNERHNDFLNSFN